VKILIQKISLITMVILTFATHTSAQSYPRPALDKTTHLGTVWSHANPWFLPDRPRIGAGGGPDFAWHRFTDDPVNMWKQVAIRYKDYGLTGLCMEINDNAGWINIFLNALEGFRLADNDMQLAIHLGLRKSSVEGMTANISKTMDVLGDRLTNHPNLYRISGRPVIFIYGPGTLNAKEWKQVISSIEAKYGSMVWLVNIAHGSPTPKLLREYMEAFDGVSMYGCWTTNGQRKLLNWLTPIMHNEFPEKLFEAAVHTNYTSHFHYGGMDPHLTKKYRDSWMMVLKAKPDSITVTNWFDVWENSRIMPSYELGDIRLRILQYYADVFRGQAPRTTQSPDLYVANLTSALLGQWMEFEVIGFPCRYENDKTVKVRLELCDDTGKLLYAFEERTMVLDKLQVERYLIPSETFSAYRAVRPRLATKWGDRGEGKTPLLPPTNIETSLRSHLLFWCRAKQDLIKVKDPMAWSIDNSSPGSTYILNQGGERMVLSDSSFSTKGNRWVRVLRNGRELAKTTLSLKFSEPIEMPAPKGALNWYNLELENSAGSRYLSPSIWVMSEDRQGNVTLPIWSIVSDEPEVKYVEVEAVRVPFFQYDCDRNTGKMLMDSSGYRHHGRIGKGHLSNTGYNHEHIGRVGPGTDPSAFFLNDSDGNGYLEFDGKGAAIIQGGTAFPYASTYEISIKPMRDGVDEVILGSANNQIRITRLADGHIQTSRKGATEGEGGTKPKLNFEVVLKSEVKVPIAKWTNIAVVYDLKNLLLYINGQLQDSKPLQPSRASEWINPIVVGGDCSFPFNPKPSFKGGVKKIRIYGRNLSPKEFLQK